ncbi:MAG: hypothetical protein E7272_01330 [Pseudobutyrivibrio ruminis]|uniref:Uncharacterized protein n=1 Tax=Pseudobutyrivibrio ruminis TaxID=46206 RepID=A0A927U9H0_9FIRM|nr:hypothetical protein [Pseudobutyrivibrio ruminis]
MVKKGFFKKTGCILISASIILTGVMFFDSSTSEADGENLNQLEAVQEEIVKDEIVEDQVSEDAVLQELKAEEIQTDTTEEIKTGTTEEVPAVVVEEASKQEVVKDASDSTTPEYTDGGATLKFVPAGVGNEFTVPETVTRIAEDAFSESSVNVLHFAGARGGDQITSIGSQANKWPANGTVVYCLGSQLEDESTVSSFFLARQTATRKITIYYSESDINPDPTPVETYAIKYKLVKANGETSTIDGGESTTIPSAPVLTVVTDDNNITYKWDENAAAVSDKTCTFTFVEQASASDPLVTITEEFYDSKGTTKVSTNVGNPNHYKKGTIIVPAKHDGYKVFDEPTQYEVTEAASQAVTFKYKASGTTPTPVPNGNTSGGSSGASATPAVTNKNQLKNEIDETLLAKYQVIKGANQTVVRENGPVEIVCNGEVNKLTGIFVDKVRIDPSRYTIASGSTILTFTGGFVKLFSTGDHVVRFEYVDGYAETGLKVTEGKTTTTVTYKVSSDGSISSGHIKDTTPKTADGFDNKYLLCIAIFLLGAGSILFSNQRKLEAILAGENDDE